MNRCPDRCATPRHRAAATRGWPVHRGLERVPLQRRVQGAGHRTRHGWGGQVYDRTLPCSPRSYAVGHPPRHPADWSRGAGTGPTRYVRSDLLGERVRVHLNAGLGRSGDAQYGEGQRRDAASVPELSFFVWAISWDASCPLHAPAHISSCTSQDRCKPRIWDGVKVHCIRLHILSWLRRRR
jgi:hypothetical protein